MDFGEVLTKTWKIIWKFKVLWIFGILASCGQSGGGGGGGGGGSGYQASSNRMGQPFGANFSSLANTIDSEPWVLAAIIAASILIGLLLFALVMAIQTVGRIGLIQGAATADKDENAALTFSGLFNSGKPFFWRILAVNLLLALAVFLVILLFVLAIIAGTIITLGLGLLCFFPLLFLIVPVFWLFMAYMEQVNIAIVVEDLGIQAGLQRGWEVFRANIGTMIVMALILVMGGFLAGLLLALPLILTIIPLAIGVIALASGDSAALGGGGLAVAGLCCLAYLPVLLVASGMISAYTKSAWTLTYLRLIGAPAPQPVPPAVITESPEIALPPEAEQPAQTVSEASNLPEDF
jgi:hypothetical protein